MQSTAKRRLFGSVLAMSPFLLYTTYLAVRRAGVALLYKPAPLGDCQVVPDINYCADCNGQKHRLDLYLPPGRDWLIFIFVHGGALISGDKCLHVCGADVYGNIGRFYASRGIGVALINYRLQPQVTCRIVLALSRPDKAAAPAILAFIRKLNRAPVTAGPLSAVG